MIKMIRVIFQNSKGIEREIGTATNDDAAWKIISDFLKEKNYKKYYVRQWVEGNRTFFDVGSHTEFFITENII